MMAAPSDLLRDQPAADGRAAEDLRALLDVAQFLSRPSVFVDPSRLAVGPFGATAVAAMRADPAFRVAVDRTLAETLFAPASGAASWDGFGAEPAHRVVAAMLVTPIDRLVRVARLLGAAALSRRITALLLLTDRRAVRAALEDEAFRFATEEAPLMFNGLTRLATDAATGRDLVATITDRAEIRAFCVSVLAGFVAHTAPAAAPLLMLRLPPQPTAAISFDATTFPQALRLINRKEPRWSGSIA